MFSCRELSSYPEFRFRVSELPTVISWVWAEVPKLFLLALLVEGF